MVNLEVMFLTRTECSLNNSKAKSSRNFVEDPDGNTHCCRSTIFEYFRINYENDKDNDSKDTKIDHNFINCLLTSGSASCCYWRHPIVAPLSGFLLRSCKRIIHGYLGGEFFKMLSHRWRRPLHLKKFSLSESKMIKTFHIDWLLTCFTTPTEHETFGNS